MPSHQPLHAMIAARTRLGLTQQDVADAVGKSLRQISRYELGVGDPTLPVARQIAELLGITIDELAGRAQRAPVLVEPVPEPTPQVLVNGVRYVPAERRGPVSDRRDERRVAGVDKALASGANLPPAAGPAERRAGPPSRRSTERS